MKTYTINKKTYYYADDLKKFNPHIFKGCQVAKSFATKHDLADDKYTYARLNENDKWIKSDGSSKKFDKLFLRKRWFDEKYLSTNTPEEEVKDAPDIIKLEDNEKFFNNDGEIVEIEVRGKREFDGCFFKLEDIINGFDIPNLHSTITDKRGNYKIKSHYVYLFISGNSENKKIKKLFLTYTGIMRVLFGSNKNTGDKFLKWASQTLFTAQMGTDDQKTVLTSKLLKVHPDVIKSVFDKSVSSLPCIYLFSIGTVKDLRKSLKIPAEYDKEEIVYKWGTTIDIKRRTREHKNDFGKIEGTNPELVLFGFIDPQYMHEAETKIKDLFKGMDLALNLNKYDELAIIPKNKFKLIKQQYDITTKAYIGHIREITEKIKDKDHEIELLKKDNEIALMKKDLEIANLKLKKNK